MPDLAYSLFKVLCGAEVLSPSVCLQHLRCSMHELKLAYVHLRRVGIEVSWHGPCLSLPSFCDCLHDDVIRTLLGDVAEYVTFLCLLLCESTNTYAADMCRSGMWCAQQQYVVACELQTRGRGRFQRAWYTECSKGLAFSYVWSPKWDHAFDDQALPLVVAFLVAQALTQLGFTRLQLKWPNDVLLCTRKVSGILVEKITAPQSRAPCYVMGVGLNVYPFSDKEASGAYAVLYEGWLSATAAFPTRDHITSTIIRCLVQGMRVFCEHGFGYFRAMWIAQQAWRGCRVTVTVSTHVFEGVLCGVDCHGCLLLDTKSVGIQSFSTGTVRLC